MNLEWRPGTQVPGYYTQKELLAAFKMSRQNFYQSGLAAAVPSVRAGRSNLYPAETVRLWRYWLYCRRAWIALGLYPADKELVPEGGKIPGWVDDAEYEWDCPVCGGLAIGPADPDDLRIWCAEHGVQACPD